MKPGSDISPAPAPETSAAPRRNVALMIPTLMRGGAETQSVLLASYLQASHNVFFYVLYGERIDQEYLARLTATTGIKIFRLTGSMPKKLSFLRRSFRENDIHCLFNYLTKADFWGAAIGRLAGIPKIYSGIESTFLSWWKVPLEMAANRFMRAKIIFNSQSAMEKFTRRWLSAKDSLVIHNGIELHELPLKKNPAGSLRVLTLARFVMEKDFRTSLLAVRDLLEILPDAEIEYAIGGYGPEEAHIRSMIAEFGLSDTVRITIAPKPVGDFLDTGDIYLSTSIIEGTSNSVMEAMDHRLPVVATDAGDNRILVKDGVTGFICPLGDHRKLAERIAEIYRNSRIAEMGNAGHQRLVDTFSIGHMTRKYLDIIEQ